MLDPRSPRGGPALALGLLLAAGTWSTPSASAQDSAPSSPPDLHAALAETARWRWLGPVNPGGRVTDLAVDAQDDARWFVATAGGGVWRTTNAGTTWKHVFRDEPVSSIGDVAVAPSDPSVVWVGSGEENARNSVQWGNGVYKSTDGGDSWQHVGLAQTFQIGHIAIHPENPEIVYVAALGRLWGDNPDRGVYRTRDGGESWERVLHLDDRTGCIDVRLDPDNPDIVHACMYERQRDAFDGNDPAVRFGEKAGYYRSTDAGDSWQRSGEGLPTVRWGRSGLTVYAKDPKVLYLIVETERSGWATGTERLQEEDAESDGGDAFMGITGGDAEGGGARLNRVTPDGPAEAAGLETGDVVTQIDDTGIDDYAGLIEVIRSSSGGTEASVTYTRDDEEHTATITWGTRRGGGRGRAASDDPHRGPYSGRLYGQQPNRQDDQGEAGHQTGGVFRSDDRGASWERVNSLTDRPFYYSVLAVDPSNDQNIWSVGTALFASFDGGAEFDEVHRRIHVDFHALWIDPSDSDHVVVAGDGGVYETFDRAAHWRHVGNLPIAQFYHVDVDRADPYHVYGGLQDNGTWVGPSRTRWREGILPEDWVTVYGGDGFRAKVDPEDPDVVFVTSQNGGIGRVSMSRASASRVQKPRGAYNWDTPFFLSPHNSRILYFAGSRAARSLDRGRHSEAISEPLGRTDRGTATAFAESPRQPGLLYVGTDDGALWRSDDGGAHWEALHDKLIGLAGPRYVSSIQPSHHADDRVYVTFDGHRSDDFATYVLVSEDRGKTWRSLADTLPEQHPAHVLIEDPRHAELLFCGTEFAAFASLDRGAHWQPLRNGMPTLQVRDLVLQDRDSDLVAATHGGGVLVLDVSTFRETAGNEELPGRAVHLFQPERVTRWITRSRYTLGHRGWTGANPRAGAPIHLWLAEAPGEDAAVTIHALGGERIGKLDVEDRAGLHSLRWSTRVGRGRRSRAAPPGTYSVRYAQGEAAQQRALLLRADPGGAGTPLSAPFVPGVFRPLPDTGADSSASSDPQHQD